jgi:hypothetical protein
VQVTEGLALEPVRHFRKGGYRWGDMESVAKHVPDAIKVRAAWCRASPGLQVMY